MLASGAAAGGAAGTAEEDGPLVLPPCIVSPPHGQKKWCLYVNTPEAGRHAPPPPPLLTLYLVNTGKQALSRKKRKYSTPHAMYIEVEVPRMLPHTFVFPPFSIDVDAHTFVLVHKLSPNRPSTRVMLSGVGIYIYT